MMILYQFYSRQNIFQSFITYLPCLWCLCCLDGIIAGPKVKEAESEPTAL